MVERMVEREEITLRHAVRAVRVGLQSVTDR